MPHFSGLKYGASLKKSSTKGSLQIWNKVSNMLQAETAAR